MQKRRGHNGHLPMTESDDTNQHDDRNNGDIPSSSSYVVSSTNNKGGQRRIRRKKGSRRGVHDFSNIVVIGCTIVAAGLIIGSIFLHSRYHLDVSNSNETSKGGLLLSQRRRTKIEDEQPLQRTSQNPQPHLPLSQFESLQYPLSHAKLVGLYFAASWCPDCTSVTKMMDEYLGDTNLLLPPPSPPTAGHDQNLPDILSDDDERSAVLSIVFVSSDTVEENFERYIRPNWIAVPFHSSERTALKKHFLVCSKPEVERLGIQREYEIPTLLILDSQTQEVLSESGDDDMIENGEKVLDYWMDIRTLARSLEA